MLFRSRLALEREKFKSEEAYRAGEREFKEKMVRLEASLRPKEFYNQLLGMATNPKDPNYEFAKNLLEARGGRSGGSDRRMTVDQATDNVKDLMLTTDIIKQEQAKDKAAGKPIRDVQTIRNDLIREELDRAAAYGGVAGTAKPGAASTSHPADRYK